MLANTQKIGGKSLIIVINGYVLYCEYEIAYLENEIT